MGHLEEGAGDRPSREWLYDIQDWCGACVHDLNTSAQTWSD